jgi:site-specific DNA-methyltransferase (adenine-specific)
MGQQLSLFVNTDVKKTSPRRSAGQTREQVKRLDLDQQTRERILPLCRLSYGEIWEDPVGGHRVGVLDATKLNDVKSIIGDEKSPLMINDPPYNVKVGNANTRNLSKTSLETYMDFSRRWVSNAIAVMKPDAHFYVWMGTDYRDGFQPLPDLIIMMRDFEQLKPRNLITMRNQRGYGTQKNWMWVRQELLYYVQGNPDFSVVYTDIPKVVKGYYRKIDGKLTENLERSKSNTIRPGNVWFDIQQVFYRMEENVSGCYAQKPIKAMERIIESGRTEGDLITDFFAHSGTTLIAGERLGRRVYTFDVDPIFVEITIRRLEHYRKTGKTGWQWHTPFPEIDEKAD